MNLNINDKPIIDGDNFNQQSFFDFLIEIAEHYQNVNEESEEEK